MSTKPESRRQRRIRHAIESRFPGSRFIKVHGSEYQNEGEPDLIGCVDGRFVAFEIKEPGNDPSSLQLAVLALWHRAGAITGVVEDPDEAITIILLARSASKGGR